MHTKRLAKLLGVVLLAGALALAVTACGGSSSSSSSGDASESSASTTTVTGQKGDKYEVTSEARQVSTEAADADYEPYTITLNLERSGIGQNMEETFTAAPTKAICDGDQMADMLFDLGLEDHMAGFTRGACWSTVNEYPARDTVKKLTPDGMNLRGTAARRCADRHQRGCGKRHSFDCFSRILRRVAGYFLLFHCGVSFVSVCQTFLRVKALYVFQQ